MYKRQDQLKQGMGLRGYGQRDPIVEYRIEGFAMFDEMIATIREDAVHMLLTLSLIHICQRCLLYAAFRRQNADHLLF